MLQLRCLLLSRHKVNVNFNGKGNRFHHYSSYICVSLVYLKLVTQYLMLLLDAKLMLNNKYWDKCTCFRIHLKSCLWVNKASLKITFTICQNSKNAFIVMFDFSKFRQNVTDLWALDEGKFNTFSISVRFDP